MPAKQQKCGRVECIVMFTPVRAWHLYCSDKCRNLVWVIRKEAGQRLRDENSSRT